LEAESALILATSGSATLNFGEAPQEAGGTKALSSGIGVFVSLKGIDVSAECRRLNNEVSRLDKQLESLAAKLGNAQFVSRAPADVVAREREKEKVWRDQRDVLTAKLTALGCG
jgi:valyl-tRNA synthetase